MLYENIVWEICISNSRNLFTRDLLAQDSIFWSSLWQVDNCTSIKQTLYRMNDGLWISLNCASGYLLLLSAVKRWVIEPHVFCNSVFDNLVSNSIVCATSQFPCPLQFLCPTLSPIHTSSYLYWNTHLYFLVSTLFFMFCLTSCKCTVFTAQNECDLFLIKTHLYYMKNGVLLNF